MPKEKRCPFCRRLFIPDARLKEQQRTCGRQECRRQRKQQSNENWRSQHPDYFRAMYPQQKEVYGTRAEYRKQYRKKNPEYVQRNAAFVKKYRMRRRKPASETVSSTSRDLLLSICSETGNVSITHVSSTSHDILITVSQSEV